MQRGPGRPQVTSHAEIESAAFALFDSRGFEATTMEAIAEALGGGRRTLFRYYPSKNDIPWGQFDASLHRFRQMLDSMPHDLPVYRAVHDGVLAFNRFDPDAMPQHRRRMRMLLRTPALEAHSVLRYQQWRQVIADYVGERLGVDSGDLLPQTVGRVSLALALAAYERWLGDEAAVLEQVLEDALQDLRGYLSPQR